MVMPAEMWLQRFLRNPVESGRAAHYINSGQSDIADEHRVHQPGRRGGGTEKVPTRTTADFGMTSQGGEVKRPG